jgi:hypothetical protein
MNRPNPITRAFLGTLILAAGSLVGCSGHGNYNPEDRKGNIGNLPDPNQPNIQRVYTTALQYVISRYRQGGEQQPIAINLPPGTRQSNYFTVAGQVGKNVEPLTQAIANTNSMPIYHVGAIQLRGNNANVDIYRPTTEIEPDPRTGKPVYQVIRVKLEGGLQPWRALIGRSYAPGMLQPPQYYVLPPTEDAFQFENWKKEQRAIAFAQERAGLEARIEQMPTGSTAVPVPAPAKDVDPVESNAHADGQPVAVPPPQ